MKSSTLQHPREFAIQFTLEPSKQTRDEVRKGDCHSS